MSRINLYQILFNRTSLEETQFISLIKFLQAHPDRFIPTEDARSIFSTRALVNTAIGKIFAQAQSQGVLDQTKLFLNPTSREAGGREPVPVLLSYRHLCLDTQQIAESYPHLAPALNVLSDLKNTLILNVTPYITRGINGFIQRDSDNLHSYIVRDLLCKSYNLSKTSPSWLEGDILQTTAHIYGTLFASTLARGYDMSREVQLYMQSCATLYYLGLMQTDNIALSTIQGKARRFYLPVGAEMTVILEKIESIIGKPVPQTLDDVIAAINGLEIPRLMINRGVISDSLKSIAPDPISSVIAVEYPPYFVWALLLTLIGKPSYLSIFVKKQKLNRDISDMAEHLVRSHLFLPEMSNR